MAILNFFAQVRQLQKMLKFEEKKHPAKIYRRVTKLCTLLDHTMYPYNPHQHIQKSIFFNFQPALMDMPISLSSIDIPVFSKN